MKVYAAEVPAPEFVFTAGRYDHAATEKAQEEYIEKVRKDALAYGSHPLAGEIVRTPYADGSAEYMIAKIDGKVSLIHLEVGDAWRDPAFERTATVKELKIRIEEARKREAFWAAHAVRS